MPNSHCCSDMSNQIENWKCDTHEYRYDCPDAVITYAEIFNEYGLIIHGEPSSILVQYCPWCWKKLPDSMRNEWFDELQKLWYNDPLFDDSIPETFKSKSWRDNLK